VADNETVTVGGTPVWERHVLVDDVRPPLRGLGDLLGVPGTGPSSVTTSNGYDGSCRIPVVFVADGVARLAARREPWPDPLAPRRRLK